MDKIIRGGSSYDSNYRGNYKNNMRGNQRYGRQNSNSRWIWEKFLKSKL